MISNPGEMISGEVHIQIYRNKFDFIAKKWNSNSLSVATTNG